MSLRALIAAGLLSASVVGAAPVSSSVPWTRSAPVHTGTKSHSSVAHSSVPHISVPHPSFTGSISKCAESFTIPTFTGTHTRPTGLPTETLTLPSLSHESHSKPTGSHSAPPSSLTKRAESSFTETFSHHSHSHSAPTGTFTKPTESFTGTFTLPTGSHSPPPPPRSSGLSKHAESSFTGTRRKPSFTGTFTTLPKSSGTHVKPTPPPKTSSHALTSTTSATVPRHTVSA